MGILIKYRKNSFGVIDIKDKSNIVEVWGDVVQIKSLLISIIISIISTMGAFFYCKAQ